MKESKLSKVSGVFFTEIGSEHIPIVLFPGFARYKEVLHFITTRQGGYSEKPFHSFNLASHIGDKEEHVFNNRVLLAKSLGISPEDFIFTQQEHGSKVIVIEDSLKLERRKNLHNYIQVADALITDKEGLCLLIFVADCVPVLLYDFRKRAIGLVHAGWRGTVDLISQKTVRLMQSYYDCRVQDIICALGPSIGPCCYEVGEEVLEKVKAHFPGEEKVIRSFSHSSVKKKFFFDLWQANKIQLLECGVPEKNIEIANLCTFCHSDIFFSSRKEHQSTGRFAAGIMLRK